MAPDQPDMFAALGISNAAANAAIPHAKKDLRHCGIWGSARGANPQSAAQCRGQSPSKRNAAEADRLKVQNLRDTLREISALKAELVSDVDQYHAGLKAHREALETSFKQAPLLGAAPAVKAERERHYDGLLSVSINHGQPYREYVRLGQLSKAIEREIETLTTKGKS